MADRRSFYRLNGVAHVAGSIGDEAKQPLVSAFIERWHPETHTFHMPFGECTVTLQDVAFQLGLPVDREAVLFGELPLPNKVEQMMVHFSWFHERFSVLPPDANEETIRIYARAYIMMLLSTQLFGDKSANRVHIRWLPFVANLDDMGRWSAYLPLNDSKEQRVLSYQLALDRLTARDIVWEPYSVLDVLAMVHPEILTEEHSRIWVVLQLGEVQHIPEDALNIDWLHAKDGRGGDRFVDL
ncbi:hypothetical protein Ahy_A06g026342 [Arachis hypogaea]|uniref:Aminotransferase-like plant mobile domain-containing protein n=1 Tax=Arachis hypogaea TaxID=3818 RepID=A0A445CK77_ARAHY|nr:hypothetical protein Ahy_A06g026342 [Arachis hypogaea]